MGLLRGVRFVVHTHTHSHTPHTTDTHSHTHLLVMGTHRRSTACLGNPTKTEACLLSDEAALFAGVTSPVPSGARPPWWDDLAWWDFRCRVTACSSGL